MEILTPFQKEALKAIGESPLVDNFYLTGGTALSAFYLQHRLSEDLDFFSPDPNAIRLVRSSLETVAKKLEASLEFNRTFNTFVECFLTSSDGEILKLDFAQSTPYRLQPTEFDQTFGIYVDNSVDVSCNKLSALFDRADAKDFVDIFFINQELMPFDELLSHARQKHVGMDDYWLAISLQRIQRINLLPRMIKPLALDDLQAYFLDLAQELMSRIEGSELFHG